MSYYNYCFIPCTRKITKEQEDDKHYVFNENDSGFENMLKLMNLDDKFIQKEEFTDIRYVVFKEVPVGNDVLRPRDLNWQWHDKETFYSHADCFIFVHELYERVLWSNIDKEYIKDFEKSVALYQNGIKKYGNELVVFPI